MGKKWYLWIAASMLVVGIGVMLYPAVSSAVNRRHGTYAIQQMQLQLENMDAADMESQLEAAREYNVQLQNADMPEESDYKRILDFGNGIMGYITIEKIGLLLPIYHGVDTQTLEKGVGHLPSSAFPVGGDGNHTVLTGHTGLPSARLFTDLTELSDGDQFSVTVGSHSVCYQIDQVIVVLPEETQELSAVAGEDYCTLVTCTPYGVNSHRLLVRGSRIDLQETDAKPENQTTVEKKEKNLRYFLVLLFLPLLLLLKRKKGRNG